MKWINQECKLYILIIVIIIIITIITKTANTYIEFIMCQAQFKGLSMHEFT